MILITEEQSDELDEVKVIKEKSRLQIILGQLFFGLPTQYNSPLKRDEFEAQGQTGNGANFSLAGDANKACVAGGRPG